MKLGFVKGT